jgi:hypothetical protein
MSLGPGVGFFLSMVALNVVILAIPDNRIPVMEYTCAGSTSDENCKIVKASTLEYRVNTRTGVVSWSVRRNAGNYTTTGGIYEQCAVADRRNWKCTDADGGSVSIINGVYQHTLPANEATVFHGYVNGRYRRERIREWIGSAESVD